MPQTRADLQGLKNTVVKSNYTKYSIGASHRFQKRPIQVMDPELITTVKLSIWHEQRRKSKLNSACYKTSTTIPFKKEKQRLVSYSDKDMRAKWKTESKANYQEVTRKQNMGKRNWSYTGLFHTPGVQGHPPAIVGLSKNRFPSGLLTSESSHIFLWKQKQTNKTLKEKEEGLIQLQEILSFMHSIF